MTKFLRTHHHHVVWLSISGAISILLFAAVGVGAITYERAYQDRIFPGVSIGPIPVGELTRVEALTRVQQVLDAYLGQGLPYVLDGRLVNIDPVVVGQQDLDLSYRLVDVDVPTLVDDAFAVGRRSSFRTAWVERARGALRDNLVVPLRVAVAEDRLARALTENLSATLQPMEPPRLTALHRDGAVTWSVREGRPGRAIDPAAVAAATTVRIAALDPAAIPVTTTVQEPPYTKTDVEASLPLLDAALRRAPLTLTRGNERWVVEQETLATWLTVRDGPQPTIDAQAVDAFLAPIVRSIERPAENARLTINASTKRVREFRAAREGVRIDRAALTAVLHEAVFGITPPLIPIPILREPPSVALADTNDLGIRELLGVGRTSFAGSPANRRHNIKVGAGLLNGILIAPREEFSTVKAVSPFTAENGYKPELVIKGTRTIPEYGGGLCQVSTTLFRTVLAAGLPITERTAHAYRVPYYEPPVGMDATIYGPKPDFKFVNDTPAHLLLLTRIEGDELIYELWGTKDGRIATASEPEVTNYVNPSPTKIVETEDLAPGQRKCTERAHTGADAKFTYTVTYADGRKEEVVFKSHYRPWQAVCLIGKSTVDSRQSSGSEPTATPPEGSSSPSTTTPPLTPPPAAPAPTGEPTAPPQVD